MIRVRGHRFVKVRPLNGLDRRHDLGASTAVPVTLSFSTSAKAALKAVKS
jgi:hypothetical protein